MLRSRIKCARATIQLTPQLTLLNVHVPWAQYRDAKALFDAGKARRLELKARLDEAKAGDQPLLDLQAELVDSIKKLERQRNVCTDKHVAASAKLAASATQLSRHVRDIADATLTRLRRATARARRPT